MLNLAEQQKKTAFIGKCNFRGNEQIFGIKSRDRRQHMYVVGKTGTGKTTLLENMALQDIHCGRGIGIIDPHGEFVERVLAQIPRERADDVIYFNPVDSDYPIGFNVLEVPDLRYKHLVVSDLLGIFTKIWSNVWSARMEYILQNCILALLDTPGTTLLGIPRILVDKDYRQTILKNVQDPVVRSFWMHEYETWRDQFRNEAIVPIQNKVGQFLNTSFIRNIVGQPKSTLRIPHIMNEGKILLVNVSKGQIGEDNSALLGAMIITKVQLAAMERVRVPEEDRRDFYLYIDEFQNFATDSFASILSEARKYRLNLLIAHQYVGQLVTDVSTKVRDAVFGNTGTMIAFRVGATDAEFLEKEFTPEFVIEDLTNLPNYHVYLKLMVNGVTSRPFSAVTLPPIKYEIDPTVKERIITTSRTLYTRPRAEVEEEISQWSSGLGSATSDGEETGKLHESTCWNCGKTATTPFKPDGKRPVYCLSCLKKIEDGKLVPLPERMPQVGRARYSASLGDIGIEFETAPQQEGKQSPAKDRMSSVDRPPRSTGGSGGERPPFRPGPAPDGHKSPHDRGPSGPQHPNPQQRQPIYSKGPIQSRPVVRVFGNTRPVSLSQLRPKDDRNGSAAGEGEHMRHKQGFASRPSVDVAGLRRILEDALETETKEGNGMAANKKELENRGATIKPGEAIKF